jgi:hypothetical protein
MRWEMTAVTAVALEKEIAVEIIGDILSHTGENFVPYLEKTIESTMILVEHSYEGVRKAAISTLWRAYASLWALMEEHTGTPWEAGIPLKYQPTQELVKLGEVVATATMSVWGDEVDRYVLLFHSILSFEMMNHMTLSQLTQMHKLQLLRKRNQNLIKNTHSLPFKIRGLVPKLTISQSCCH